MRSRSTSSSSPLARAASAAVLAAAIASLPARAQEGAPAVRFDGFATLAATRSSSDVYRFHNQVTNDDGVGRGGDVLADTKAGVRLSAAPARNVDLVLQAVAKEDPKGDFRPKVDWAYIGVDLSEAFSVRVGRMRSPSYLISETLDVGFLHPWLRPPTDAYQRNVFSSPDGLSIFARTRIGDFTVEAQGLAGREELDFPSGPIVNRPRLVALRAEREHFSAAVSYARTRISFDSSRLGPFVDFIGRSGFPDAAADYDASDTTGNYVDAGFTWEPGPWLVMAEFNRFTSPARTLPSAKSGYLTVGYRFGKLMPHLTLSGVRSLVPREDDRLPPPLAAAARAALASLQFDQDTAAIGLRWDIGRSQALKIQVDRTRVRDGATGSFTAPVPPGARPTTVAIAWDVVF
jgi:hypothetical protein